MDPVSQLANTARVALGPRAGDRTLVTDEILTIVRASAPSGVGGLTSGHSFTEAEIEAAARDLEALFVVAQGPSIRAAGRVAAGTLVSGRTPPAWCLLLALSPEAQRGAGWAPKAVEVLEESTAEVVELIDDPEREGPWDWRGARRWQRPVGQNRTIRRRDQPCGRRGYRVIIVLAGMHKILRRQTQLRLDQDFLGFDTAGRHSGWRTPSVGRRPSAGPVQLVDSVTTSLLRRWISAAPWLTTPILRRRTVPFVFVVKKNGAVLKNLNRWIARLPEESREAPLLVIDDEADQRRLIPVSRGFCRDGSFDEDYDHQAHQRPDPHAARRVQAQCLYRLYGNAIRQHHDPRRACRARFRRRSVSRRPSSSRCPHPTIILDRLRSLVAMTTQTALVCRSSAISTRPARAWIPDPHDKSLRPVWSGEARVPPSLAEAIRSFVICCAARAARGQANAHKTMLVHVSRFQDVHDPVHAQVEAELRSIRNAIAADDSNELAALERLLARGFRAHTDADGIDRVWCDPSAGSAGRMWWPDSARKPTAFQVAVSNGRSRQGIDYDAADRGRAEPVSDRHRW